MATKKKKKNEKKEGFREETEDEVKRSKGSPKVKENSI